MTTHPAPRPTTPTGAAHVDQVLAARAATSATVLQGLITAGILDCAGQPQQLPTLMWPDTDPDTVQAIWDAAAAVGFRAGKFTAAGRWNTDHLQQARQALAATGHHHMAAALDNAMACAPSQHPADHDQHTTRPRTDDTAWESHA